MTTKPENIKTDIIDLVDDLIYRIEELETENSDLKDQIAELEMPK